MNIVCIYAGIARLQKAEELSDIYSITSRLLGIAPAGIYVSRRTSQV